MRITIRPSALAHGITDTEIRCVVEYPEHQAHIEARIPGASLTIAIGAYDVNEPYIEVIYDTRRGERIVFHAMMLRPSTITSTQLAGHIDTGRVASRQRPQRR